MGSLDQIEKVLFDEATKLIGPGSDRWRKDVQVLSALVEVELRCDRELRLAARAAPDVIGAVIEAIATDITFDSAMAVGCIAEVAEGAPWPVPSVYVDTAIHVDFYQAAMGNLPPSLKVPGPTLIFDVVNSKGTRTSMIKDVTDVICDVIARSEVGETAAKVDDLAGEVCMWLRNFERDQDPEPVVGGVA